MYRGLKILLTGLLLILGLWLGIRFLLPLALPFLLGTALALLAEPMTAFICTSLRLPRAVAAAISVTAAFCFLAILVLLLCALILRELGNLAGILPDLERAALNGMSMLSDWLLSLIQRLPDGIRTILTRNITGLFF